MIRAGSLDRRAALNKGLDQFLGKVIAAITPS